MSRMYQYNFKETTLLERFLLLFIKPHYISECEGNIMVTQTYKKLNGTIYIVKEKIEILGEKRK